MRKVSGFLVLCLFVCMFGGMSAVSAQDAAVVVGEQLVFPTDSEPIIINGRVMLPLRAISEALDATVYWFGDDKRIQIVRYDSLLSLQIGNNLMGRYIIKNGKTESMDTREMDVPAMIQNDRTYVPLRAISEAFSAEIYWDNPNRIATIIPKARDIVHNSIQEVLAAPEGTLCAVYGVIDWDMDHGTYYLRSLSKNRYGDYDVISFCTPVKTSMSDETAYGDYISAFWLEQFGTENPAGTVVDFSGITSIVEGQQRLVINKTTTTIRSLGYYDNYMKALGVGYEPFAIMEY